MPRTRRATSTSCTWANLGFDATRWTGTGELCGHMAVAEYKQVLLDLLFLKYSSDAFEEKRSVRIMNENRIIIYISSTMENVA